MATRDEGPAPHSQVTELLVRWREGDHAALEQLVPLVYEELRRLARSHLRREAAGHSIQSAGLVHEAYLRMVGKDPPDWQNRAHFFGVAARLMREILVDRTRKFRAAKRGAGAGELPLDEAIGLPHQRSVDLILLDDALERLAKLDERQCRIVELRFFAGLSLEETSVALGISEATVSREWTTARLWLRHEIAGPRMA
ncbi:sigma-70 family RNA polymerase sigma factor [Tunturiibacter lichenicola]|jgi:RNA polymerase sigma-70 factor, ECF subfamily|uniref:sigma-70 family RNA polymerase sigma factor n=1 Tax=Tunturiibacter lichenicola TaxID=2051959 RepID=UPI003D9B5CF7